MIFQFRADHDSPGPGRWVGRRARQRSGVDVFDLVDALRELPAVCGALVAVVVHGVVQLRLAVTEAPELGDVCTADRGVARNLDRARVRGLHEVVTETLQPLDPGANLLPADELDVDVGDPPCAVPCEQRREAVVSRIIAASVNSPRSASISKRSAIASRSLIGLLPRSGCVHCEMSFRFWCGLHDLSS